MTSDIRHSCNAATRVESEPDAAYRDDLVQVLAHLGLGPAEAVTFVEASTGRSFETCSPTHLLPLLQELLALVRSHGRPACRA